MLSNESKPKPESKPEPKTKLCRWCSKPFPPSREHRLFCSVECAADSQRKSIRLYCRNHSREITIKKRVGELGDFFLPPQYEFMRGDIISLIHSLPINFLKHRRVHYIPAIVKYLLYDEYFIVPARYEIKNAFNLKRTKYVTKCFKDLMWYASADKTCVVCNKPIADGEGAMFHKKLMHHACVPAFKESES